MGQSTVKSTKIKGDKRVIKTQNGKKLFLHRYACVGEDDKLLFRGNKVFVLCKNGLAQIHPPYKKFSSIKVGVKKYRIIIKEITDKKEYKAFKQLSSFHYRRNGIFGRRSVLIVKSNNDLFPTVLGYVQIASSTLFNKARSEILSSNFSYGKISWEKWNSDTAKKYINTICRIARVVVHPEFRGLGIGKQLVQNSFEYSKKHWQIGNYKPIFIDMVADMLKFIPFPERSGMTYIGDTEGNLKRVKKDLEYLIKNSKRIKKGEILQRKNFKSLFDMQLGYVRNAKHKIGNKVGDIKRYFEDLEESELSELEDNYNNLNGILRFPKPTYMKGLNNKSETFLQRRAKKLGIKNNKYEFNYPIEPIKTPIKFRNVSFEFVSDIEKTKKTNIVSGSFGISPENLKTTIFSNFNLDIRPREIILICGASGSGKTTFINLLKNHIEPHKGAVYFPKNLRMHNFDPLPDSDSLIDIIGDNVYDSIYLLNKSGLSEAYIYLRKFDELSKGQQYRAMLSNLIHSKSNVWVADEFLSTIDPITSSIIADNVRKFVKKYGITLIVAAPHVDNFAHSLKPDRVIVKSFGPSYKIIGGKEFLKSLRSNPK